MKASIVYLVSLILILLTDSLVSTRLAAQAVVTPPTSLAPQLQQTLQAAAPTAMIQVIIHLKEKEDLRDVNEPLRRQRLQKVIQRLQQRSSRTQQRLRALLQQRAKQGLVAHVQAYWVFNGLAVTATPAVIQEIAGLSEVQSVLPDTTIQAPTLSSAPAEANINLVNAPALWNAGWQGQGMVVANLDTGVDGTHPDLAAKWRGGANSWFDPYGQHPTTPVDLAGASSGHGTWTMGVMVGGDAGGTSIGMAPAAQWIAVKIFNDQGAGSTAAIHAAFQWLLDPDGNPTTDDAPHVVNNSWTYQTIGCNLEFAADLQALRAAGILPIFAAGNGGPSANTSYSPANNPGAFAVGGVNNSNVIYSSSSRGPTTCGGVTTTFPHLVAPGVYIRSSDLYSLYTNVTGTSLAAPHVSGALALLLSAYPNLTAAQQELALRSSALDLGVAGPDNDFGDGRLDVLGAYQWLVANAVNQAPTVNAGTDQTITMPATAQLSGAANDDGLPAPATLMTTWSLVSGPAAVTFGDPQAPQTVATFSAAGVYTLRLTASDGQVSTVDDVAITVNPEPVPNQTPTVNAGPDQGITLPATAQLSGVASDDGLPAPATLGTTWSSVNGPGSVTFANPQALQTTATFSAAGSYTLRLTASDGQLTSVDDLVITVNPQPVSTNLLYLSASANGNVGGVAYQDEDIVVYNPTTNRWSLVLDGSDVGLGNSDIDAFDILSDGSFLLSLDSSLSPSGLGTVRDTDVLRFTPTQLGNTTAGSFAFYLRGADVGLTTSEEDIDAIDLMPDGRLLFSTLGNVSMTGVTGADEDLIALNMSTKAATLYFDGSKVGLTASTEDVWGVWVDNTGKLYLSTQGPFAVTEVSGTGADLFTCTLLATGLNMTNCTFSSYWKGSNDGFGTAIIDGVAIGGVVPFFTPAGQGRTVDASTDADVASHSNMDDDPLNGDIYNEETAQAGEEATMQTIFLPWVQR